MGWTSLLSGNETINRAIRMMEDNGLTTRSLIVLQIVRLTFKILHAAIEVVPDFGPPKLENESNLYDGTNRSQKVIDQFLKPIFYPPVLELSDDFTFQVHIITAITG